MPFTRQFIEELHKAFGPYVIEAVESESGIAGRILDDNVETGINYKEILTATSLDELKKKAEKIALQNKVYCDFRSGQEVLSKLNADVVVNELLSLSEEKPFALICYERPGEFCHRHLVAEWLCENGYYCEEK